MGQKILLCEFDIFGSVGGGQTVYQNIVRKRPEDTFYYFKTSATEASSRPPNAISIPYREYYDGIGDRIPPSQGHFFYNYRETMNLAYSARAALGEVRLDVADTPDYRQNGLFLRNALEAHGIAVGAVVLALHGTLSSAFLHGWPWTGDPGRLFAELRQREHMQFRVVDGRYAISAFYADELQRHAPYPVKMLDPLLVIRDTEPTVSALEARAADLLFIGRRERRKGPDLFLDLAWWLPEKSYNRLMVIGGDGHNHQGTGSAAALEGIVHRRRLNAEFLAPLSQTELRKLVRQKSVVFLPSRVDQFNLVALETLLDGCPAVVSRHAG